MSAPIRHGLDAKSIDPRALRHGIQLYLRLADEYQDIDPGFAAGCEREARTLKRMIEEARG